MRKSAKRKKPRLPAPRSGSSTTRASPSSRSSPTSASPWTRFGITVSMTSRSMERRNPRLEADHHFRGSEKRHPRHPAAHRHERSDGHSPVDRIRRGTSQGAARPARREAPSRRRLPRTLHRGTPRHSPHPYRQESQGRLPMKNRPPYLST